MRTIRGPIRLGARLSAATVTQEVVRVSWSSLRLPRRARRARSQCRFHGALTLRTKCGAGSPAWPMISLWRRAAIMSLMFDRQLEAISFGRHRLCDSATP